MNYIKKKIEKKVHFSFNKFFLKINNNYILIYFSNFLLKMNYIKNINFLKINIKNYLYENGLIKEKKKNV